MNSLLYFEKNLSMPVEFHHHERLGDQQSLLVDLTALSSLFLLESKVFSHLWVKLALSECLSETHSDIQKSDCKDTESS